MTVAASTIPTATTDPVNAQILAVSEDKIQGFTPDPLGEIARLSGVELPIVIERIRAMLQAGVIRRVRQTMMATNLAPGALVAWEVPEGNLQSGFDWMFQNDPFSGHVVIRSTDSATAGSKYRLWTTLKVPQGFSMQRHCEFLCERTGATAFKMMPAKRLFALGVGHVRRRGMEPGSKSDALAEVLDTNIVELTDREWEVLMELKREFAPEELQENIYQPRAEARGIPLDEFYSIAQSLNDRKVIGRFSTFLEHVKP
ncbi:MAG: Lrp/AsnC family transcriptional regulator, partial [Anaerolineae bacterium]|nr:Lrp/AsnC family transcriptional regulator [Phycisphaerae bacterium]